MILGLGQKIEFINDGFSFVNGVSFRKGDLGIVKDDSEDCFTIKSGDKLIKVKKVFADDYLKKIANDNKEIQIHGKVLFMKNCSEAEAGEMGYIIGYSNIDIKVRMTKTGHTFEIPLRLNDDVYSIFPEDESIIRPGDRNPYKKKTRIFDILKTYEEMSQKLSYPPHEFNRFFGDGLCCSGDEVCLKGDYMNIDEARTATEWLVEQLGGKVEWEKI